MTPEQWARKVHNDLAYKAPELRQTYLESVFRQVVRDAATRPPSDEYVVVTLHRDILHVYGDPNESMDLPAARRLARQIKRNDEELHPGAPVRPRITVRKVLRDPPEDPRPHQSRTDEPGDVRE